MFNPTPNNTKHKSRSTAMPFAIAKPLALMAVLLSVSPAAFALTPCDEEQMAAAEDACESGWGYDVLSCGVTSGGTVVAECCPEGHCYPGDHIVNVNLGSHGELPEDDERGDPVDPSSTPDDADELIDEEPGFSDDEGDIRGADDGDTGRDDDDDTGRDDDDDGDTGDADPGDADTGDDGLDTGDADDTSADDEDASADDEDASVDDDDTQADGDVDTEPEVSDTSAGCSTVGQAGGGLMALILGALLGLTRRQVRWS